MFDIKDLPEFSDGTLSLRGISMDGTAAFGLGLQLHDASAVGEGMHLLGEIFVTEGASLIANVLLMLAEDGHPGIENVMENITTLDDSFGNVEMDGRVLTARVTDGLSIEAFGLGTVRDWIKGIHAFASSIEESILPAYVQHVVDLGYRDEFERIAEDAEKRGILPGGILDRMPDDFKEAIADFDKADLPTSEEVQEKFGLTKEQADEVVATAGKALDSIQEEVAGKSAADSGGDLDWD